MARSKVLGFAAAAIAAASWASVTAAQESSVVVETPGASVNVQSEAVEVAPGPVIEPESAPVVVEHAAPAIDCRPIRVLREHAAPSARRMYRCHGETQQVLCVKNPSDCCYYSVCVCVPACCVGEPVVCDTSVGLLGRGYVRYQWPCGFEAVITFRVHGGALVKYM